MKVSKAIVAAVVLLALGAGDAAGQKKLKDLAPKYRDWLEKEVVYIISDEERQLFLRLANDADREKFIEQFWLARDPTPGTPQNEFKEEHYKRIEYANQYFSGEWATEGWRTDRGKIWILLGQPQSRQYHTSGGQVYPMELWFYASREPSLPPFFYVLFYQKYGASDYRLYSPYLDGPDKLVRASGVENNRINGYRFLRDYNPELARASLTLIPSEPADINNPPSLESDTMLMKIVNIANDKFHKERIGYARSLQEQVTVRLLRENVVQVAALPLRDAAGEDFIHYALQIPEAANYTLGRYKDKAYLAVESQVRVMDANKKLVYETTREATAYFSDEQLEEAKTRGMSFEDRLPVLPGTYHLEFSLLNRINRIYYRAQATVEVPGPVSQLQVGKALLVEQCGQATSPEEPFAFGQTRCLVRATQESALRANADLRLLYPVYMPEASLTAAEPLRVQYRLGKLDRSSEPVVVDDALDRRRATRAGVLVVGKTLPLKGLTEGQYLLTVQVTDPASRKTDGVTLPVRLVGETFPAPNVLTAEHPEKMQLSGDNDFWRALCARALGLQQTARALFARALERNPEHVPARTQLALLYYGEGNYEQTVKLLDAGAEKISEASTLQTLLASLDKTGRLERAIAVAEAGLKRLDPTAALYEDLAALYSKAGQESKARQAREEARKLNAQKRPGI
jgi:GWxTD domain-containing protein